LRASGEEDGGGQDDVEEEANSRRGAAFEMKDVLQGSYQDITSDSDRTRHDRRKVRRVAYRQSVSHLSERPILYENLAVAVVLLDMSAGKNSAAPFGSSLEGRQGVRGGEEGAEVGRRVGAGVALDDGGGRKGKTLFTHRTVEGGEDTRSVSSDMGERG
jgi:hypothetical protein